PAGARLRRLVERLAQRRGESGRALSESSEFSGHGSGFSLLVPVHASIGAFFHLARSPAKARTLRTYEEMKSDLELGPELRSRTRTRTRTRTENENPEP